MEKQLIPVIAIDGPSASGKGTVAAIVAERLGFRYLDSGSVYRLVALATMRAGVSPDNQAAVAALADKTKAVFESARVLLDGEDVTDEIRTEKCSAMASVVAAHPAVRAVLLQQQQDYRQPPGLVADGRDMGSIVFPDAQLKVFLTATPEARVERRHKQLIDKGMAASIYNLLQDLRERDARDARRGVAPLKQCDDAHLIDSTNMTIEQVVSEVLRLAEQRQISIQK